MKNTPVRYSLMAAAAAAVFSFSSAAQAAGWCNPSQVAANDSTTVPMPNTPIPCVDGQTTECVVKITGTNTGMVMKFKCENNKWKPNGYGNLKPLTDSSITAVLGGAPLPPAPPAPGGGSGPTSQPGGGTTSKPAGGGTPAPGGGGGASGGNGGAASRPAAIISSNPCGCPLPVTTTVGPGPKQKTLAKVGECCQMSNGFWALLRNVGNKRNCDVACPNPPNGAGNAGKGSGNDGIVLDSLLDGLTTDTTETAIPFVH